MNGYNARAIVRTMLLSPITLNRAVARSALQVARFLTQMGATPAETFFWRMGAVISAFGAGVFAASEGGLVAALVTLRVWRVSGGILAIGGHGLLAFLAVHLLVALERGIREPRS
ncbi:hypothetical protein DAH81_24150 [Sphingomonas koreensis]|uniref:hypothetical protein n=1 Tax=Sphingomonas koreensis TaxID=93064 RepID=UPI000F7D6419|nr:hypothetical protein [Sphingomonas koreensis]RSY03901.1 hypothetical protein DAH81_24150 [Sphingomonas koreensis]